MPKRENLIHGFTVAIPTALLAALGAAFGAYWQQTYAVQLEREKTLLSIRKEAYTDFFSGQFAYHNNDTAKYQSLVQNARFAIGVYSTKPTVEALAEYFECVGVPACANSPKKWELDVKIYQQMRRELYGEDHSQRADDKTMSRVIYD